MVGNNSIPSLPIFLPLLTIPGPQLWWVVPKVGYGFHWFYSISHPRALSQPRKQSCAGIDYSSLVRGH